MSIGNLYNCQKMFGLNRSSVILLLPLFLLKINFWKRLKTFEFCSCDNFSAPKKLKWSVSNIIYIFFITNFMFAFLSFSFSLHHNQFFFYVLLRKSYTTNSQNKIPHCLNSSRIQVKNRCKVTKSIFLKHIWPLTFLAWYWHFNGKSGGVKLVLWTQ